MSHVILFSSTKQLTMSLAKGIAKILWNICSVILPWIRIIVFHLYILSINSLGETTFQQISLTAWGWVGTLNLQWICTCSFWIVCDFHLQVDIATLALLPVWPVKEICTDLSQAQCLRLLPVKFFSHAFWIHLYLMWLKWQNQKSFLNFRNRC